MTKISLSKRIDSLQPTAVNRILSEVRELTARGQQFVSLMRGEPDLSTPQHIAEAAARAIADGRTSYPNNQGEPALREAVAKHLEQQVSEPYSPDQEILIATGATFGIYAALSAILNPGDEVLIPEPIYDAYHSTIALVGGVSRSVPAKIIDHRFTLDPVAFDTACGPRTRALLLNTPWNPTGSVLRQQELESLMDVAQRKNLVVISDEIYDAIIYDGCKHVSPAAISDDARSRTVIVNSLSKTYAMTGWRLGYCAGPAALIHAMYLVLQQSSRGPSTFVQDAGVAALTGSQQCVAEMLEQYAARRKLVCDMLGNIDNVSVLIPEAGFFAMLDVHRIGIPSNELRRKLLTDFGVVVVHGAAYGSAAEGTLRVSFASGGENLETGLQRLREGLIAIQQ